MTDVQRLWEYRWRKKVVAAFERMEIEVARGRGDLLAASFELHIKGYPSSLVEEPMTRALRDNLALIVKAAADNARRDLETSRLGAALDLKEELEEVEA